MVFSLEVWIKKGTVEAGGLRKNHDVGELKTLKIIIQDDLWCSF